MSRIHVKCMRKFWSRRFKTIRKSDRRVDSFGSSSVVPIMNTMNLPKTVKIVVLPITYPAPTTRFERKMEENVGREVMRAINSWLYEN